MLYSILLDEAFVGKVFCDEADALFDVAFVRLDMDLG